MKKSIIRSYFKRLFLLNLVCCCLFYASAQTTAPKPAAPSPAKPVVPVTAAKIIDTFFKKYKDSTSAAIDYLFGTNKYFSNQDGLFKLKIKLDSLRIVLGPYIGKELIAQRSASPSLVLYSYLAKHEQQPIRFTFIFYKPHNDWVFYRFLYDDQMDLELEEGAKINNKHL